MVKKRRQHYVWRRYLEPWSTDKKIWCFNARSNAIFNAANKNTAVQRDFYKISDLSLEDLQFVKRVAIDPTNGEKLQQLNQGWVNLFKMVSEIVQYSRSINAPTDEIENAIDEVLTNMEGDNHALIENMSEQYLNSLIQRDPQFWESDDGAIGFSYYIAHQYLRTRKVRQDVLDNFDNTKFQTIARRTWPVLCHIWATNLGFSIYAGREKYQMTVLKNDTETNFITSDQPAVNTKSRSRPKDAPVKEFELYYPVSPTTAVIFSEDQKYQKEGGAILSSSDVAEFNTTMADCAHEQVYACAENDLQFLRKT